MNVLIVCEGNVHRSRTAEKMYERAPDRHVKSAGLATSARVQVHDELLQWADVLCAADEDVEATLRRRFTIPNGLPVHCLRIPDEFQYMEQSLQDILAERLAPIIGPAA